MNVIIIFMNFQLSINVRNFGYALFKELSNFPFIHLSKSNWNTKTFKFWKILWALVLPFVLKVS